MKSEKAREYIRNLPREVLPKRVGMPEAIEAVELAEQEAEERVREKAHKIILDMMTGIFHGDMPRKIADEFIQKLERR